MTLLLSQTLIVLELEAVILNHGIHVFHNVPTIRHNVPTICHNVPTIRHNVPTLCFP
jgi:hypothetical protein